MGAWACVGPASCYSTATQDRSNYCAYTVRLLLMTYPSGFGGASSRARDVVRFDISLPCGRRAKVCACTSAVRPRESLLILCKQYYCVGRANDTACKAGRKFRRPFVLTWQAMRRQTRRSNHHIQPFSYHSALAYLGSSIGEVSHSWLDGLGALHIHVLFFICMLSN